jgi:hypothetical protein
MKPTAVSPRTTPVQGRHQADARGHADVVQVVGGLGHDLAGRVVGVPGQVQALQVGEDAAAQVQLHPARETHDQGPPGQAQQPHAHGQAQHGQTLAGQAGAAGPAQGEVVDGELDQAGDVELEQVHAEQGGQAAGDGPAALPGQAGQQQPGQIGRASCRERVS